MKLKQDPGDFRVEELTNATPASEGAFGFYRLDKRGWATPDAVQVIRRRWQLAPSRLSYGGLKDRHAHTLQYFTVFHGPRRGLRHHEITVTYLGQLGHPYSSRDIRANRFRITMRDLGDADVEAVFRALAHVKAQGVPNYFDDQRFGSVGADREFVARHMVRGRYEEALRLALAGAYAHDRAPEKRQKSLLRAHWGDWAKLKQELPRGHARSLIDYLASHPADFRGALARLRPELRGLYLSAYQSHLWNRILARWLEEHIPPTQLLAVPLRLGAVPMHRELNREQWEELSRLRLPLPTAREHGSPEDPRLALMDRVLAGEGLERSELKLRGFRELFFSKGDRAALSVPAGLEVEKGADDRHPGKHRVTLSFELPPGSYATLIVKRLMVPEAGTKDVQPRHRAPQ